MSNVATGVYIILEDLLGEVPEGTPARVERAFREMLRGYSEDPQEYVGRLFDGGGYSGKVVTTGISFSSLCEHHLMPFYGTVSIGYVPRDGVIGLSKAARLVDCYAKRLQTQERMTQQIANVLATFPAWWVRVTAVHTCMTCRGVLRPGASTTTELSLEWK